MCKSEKKEEKGKGETQKHVTMEEDSEMAMEEVSQWFLYSS